MSHVIAPRFIGPALGDGGYQVGYSCRFNSADSAYLVRTPGSSSDRRKWTASFWIKRTNLVDGTIFQGYSGPDNFTSFQIVNDKLQIEQAIGTNQGAGATNAVFRDPSAWYHVVMHFDTANPAPANRWRVWVNGIEQTTTFTNDIAQNSDGYWGYTVTNYLATHGNIISYLNAYLSQFCYLNAVLEPFTSFGEFDSNGVWRPIDVLGLTFGTNGFLLDFAHNATANDLGLDAVGSNDFAAGGSLAITDQMFDAPTNNYCVLNPLDSVYSGQPPRDGNLVYQWTTPNQWGVVGTIAPNDGKFYWETVVTAGAIALCLGVVPQDRTHRDVHYPFTGESGHAGIGNNAVVYLYSGVKEVNGVTTSYGATYAVNDVIGVALDLVAQTVTFYKNNASQGAISLPVADESWTPCYGGVGDYFTIQTNFGQSDFTYTPPSDFEALRTANLPKPASIDSVTPITGSFPGNGSTDGPFVWLGYTPNTSGTSTINGNTITWGTHARPTAGGFKVISSSSSYNNNGVSNSYSIAVAHPFGGKDTTPMTAR